MSIQSTILSICLLALCCVPAQAAGNPLPDKDAPKTKDHPLIGRYGGSVILSREDLSYDEAVLPLSTLKLNEQHLRDNHNNIIAAPDLSKHVEGKRTRLLYLIPEGVTPLQVLRNYEGEIAKKEGKVLFGCVTEQCGVNSNSTGRGGGGYQNISMFLWDQDRIHDKHDSPADCAQNSSISDMRFAAVEVPARGAHLSLQTYRLGDSDCPELRGRTIAIVDIIEGKTMDRNMVVLDAGEMSKSIASEGRVALYGLYFDSGKSQIKAESKATLDQIARLLASDQKLKLLVVGHTDNDGGFAGNMDLSRRRAEAVVAALVSQYHVGPKRLQPVGVSYASPVAANSSEEGKAKNRRVELVPAD